MLLTVAFWANLAGQSHLRAIAAWARERQDELAAHVALPRARRPQPTTWSRVLGTAVAADALEDAITRLLTPPATGAIPDRAPIPSALDGKTRRGTLPAGQPQGVHLLSASAVQAGVALTQEAVARKAHARAAAPRRLHRRDLRGTIVRGDAMVAQRNRSLPMVEAGGASCWSATANQPPLRDDRQLLFRPSDHPIAQGERPLPLDFVVVDQYDKGHGRRAYRRLTPSTLVADYSAWPYLAQACAVIHVTWQGRNVSRAERYGMTSAPRSAVGPRSLLEVVRGHWHIEKARW
ncbi:MAG: ISAs1 family transposase [Chloroflexales bacterium]|nr:ISAs1 family transposase [Chloroflexales bacterium]